MIKFNHQHLQNMKNISIDQDINLTIQPTEFMRNDFYKEDLEKDEELVELLQPAFTLVSGLLQTVTWRY